MKKYASLLLFAAVGLLGSVRAQVPLRQLPDAYISTRWTSLDGNPLKFSCPVDWGAYGEWHTFGQIDSITQGNFKNNGNFIIGNQLMTDHPVKIVGIAACAYMQGVGDTTLRQYLISWATNAGEWAPELFFPNVRDTSVLTRITDSLILYKPVGNNLVQLRSAPWRMEQQHESLVLPPEISIDTFRALTGLSDYVFFYDAPGHPHYYDMAPVSALYVSYFDEPVVVEDSFVVAGTALNNDGSYGLEFLPGGEWDWMWLWDHRATRYWTLKTFDSTDRVLPFGEQICWRKYRSQNWKRIDMRGYRGLSGSEPRGSMRFRHFTMLYPIIDLQFDTAVEHCQPVDNVRIVENTDSTATLAWDAVNSVQWEVKYGMVGMDEEYYTMLTTSAPTVTLAGLNTSVQYRVYVRGWCPCDSSWGDWVGPKVFRLQAGQHEGIDEAGDLGRYTYLLPNPAHGRVSVISSLRLSRVEVYDLKGRRVLEQDVDGISAVLDVSPLASGTYIVALHTPSGIATKKLVVQ